MRTKRRAPGSEPHSEQIDVRTDDGWSLRSDVLEPARDATGVVVMAHALMACRREFDRPEGAGIARMWLDHGWRVITFDFRAHGDSGSGAHPAADVGYDDFVVRDLPAVHAFARSRGRPKQPVVLVGHSLGGHAALAAQAAGLVAFDGLVIVGASVWLRELESSPGRWLAKRASLLAALAVSRRLGRFPARGLRLGSDDVPRACCDDFDRFARTGQWKSADGRVDYLASLSLVKVPVLQMVSDRDRLECTPECGARFIAHCGGPHEIIRISRGDDGGPPPSHMGLVTSGRVRSAWERAERSMRRVRC